MPGRHARKEGEREGGLGRPPIWPYEPARLLLYLGLGYGGARAAGRGRRVDGRARARAGLSSLPPPSFLPPFAGEAVIDNCYGRGGGKDRGEGRERAFRKREGDSEL